MDTMMIKERNYRTVEMLRHQNDREQRRLEANLYSSGGLEANHRYNLENMSREQQLLKQELGRLKQTTSTSWGLLPPRPGEQPLGAPSPDHTTHKHRRKSKRKPRKLIIEEQKQAEQRRQEEAVRKFHQDIDTFDSEEVNDEVKDEVKDVKGEQVKKTEEQHSPSSVPHLPQLLEREEEDGAASRATSRSTPAATADIALVDINVHDAKDSVAKRLGSASGSAAVPASSSATTEQPQPQPQPQSTSPPDQLRLPPPPPPLSPVRETAEMEDEEKVAATVPTSQQKKPQKNAAPTNLPPPKPKGSKKSTEQPAFDHLKYNPDGSLRTVHTLPDFQSSLREAMKARYLRMKGPQWVERALSNSEIFGKKRTRTAESSK